MARQATLDTAELYQCLDNVKCQRVVFVVREGQDAGRETWYRREQLRGNSTGYPW